MKRIILASLLLSSPLFANNGIEMTAKISNQNVRAKKYVGINSYHTVKIKNITNQEKTYKYTWCIQLDQRHCYGRYVTLKPNDTFSRNDMNYMNVGKERGGQYKITAITKVDDVETESNAILTVY
jgi:hypothetical protein